jgi:zinc protease
MALDITSSVLGEGRSSRLYRRLVEKDRLVSSVNCFIYPLKHTGMFVIFAAMVPANVDAFRAAVLEEVRTLRDTPLPPDELEKVKTMLAADFAFANETDADIGQSLGYYDTIGMLETYVGYRERIRQVTAGDVARYAGAVLDPDACTVGVVVPREGTGEAR